MAADASSPSSAPDPAGGSPSNDTSASVWDRLASHQLMLLSGGLLLFLVLLYEMSTPAEGGFLNPVLIAIAGIILLWPVREIRSVRALLLAGGFLLLVWFMAQVSNILIPFVLVYLLAYVLDPLVQWLHRRYGVQRWLSSLFVTLLFVGLLVGFILILAPSIANQFESLTRRVLGSLRSLQDWLQTTPLLDNLENAGLLDKQAAIEQLTGLIQTQASQLPTALQGLLESLGSLLGLITTLALVPVILFYTLKDYPHIKNSLTALFPTLGGQRDYLIKAGSIVGNYLRGQLIVSAISTINVSFWLLIGGVPFWLLIGLLSGLLNFVPNLGAIITLVIGFIVALTFGGWIKALIVAVVLLGQGFLEQSVLTPNILGQQVGLHPVLILLSLLIFGAFLGLFGLLIAVPATAILVTAYKAYREELTLELNAYGVAAKETAENG